MGLMLSLLIGCVGVIEAIACYETLKYAFMQRQRSSIEQLRNNYDTMFAESLSQSSTRNETWRLGVQGYLDIEKGRKKGPLKAQIKYLGTDEDPVPILFAQKISSFGQESLDCGYHETIKPVTPERTPDRTTSVKIQEPLGESFSLLKTTPKITPVSSRENLQEESSTSFWDEVEDEDEKPQEKIQWHYRPLTPTDEDHQSLPEIRFNSYERKSNENLDGSSTNSEDYLRSLDGIKFRPLQRDDGTGRRRSFKKRHSSSSTSSRESSKASREEELRMFTSLEESEFESYAKSGPSYASAPNLTVDRGKKSKSPSLNLSVEEDECSSPRRSKSPSAERPLLKNINRKPSFDESSENTLDADDEKPKDDRQKKADDADDDDKNTVVFRKAGVND